MKMKMKSEKVAKVIKVIPWVKVIKGIYNKSL